MAFKRVPVVVRCKARAFLHLHQPATKGWVSWERCTFEQTSFLPLVTDPERELSCDSLISVLQGIVTP